MCNLEPRTASILKTFAEGYLTCMVHYGLVDEDNWFGCDVDGIAYEINLYQSEACEPYGAYVYSLKMHDNGTYSVNEQLTDDLFALENI